MKKYLVEILFKKLYRQRFSSNSKRDFSLFEKFSSSFLLKESVVFRNHSNLSRKIMKLSSVIKVMEHIVPNHLAERWDNTGLLIEPEVPSPISTVFLTNDLTEEVLIEAVEVKANLIISYHPPIFNAMKVFVCQNWKDRVVMKCIANNIAVYSPHTACDAVEGGVNDWLIKCFGLTDVKPIKPAVEKLGVVIECIKPKPVDLNQVLGSGIQYETLVSCEYDEASMWVKILVEADILDSILKKLKEVPDLRTVITTQCRKPIIASPIGLGRIGKLARPLTLGTCIQMMKEHAKVDNIRVSVGAHNSLDTEISIIAACAGSGGSVLKDVPADLYVTGEMSHHDILDCHHRRVCVILCEHSNSERGYLNDLADRLRSKMHGVNVIVSSADKDPITIH